MNNDDYLLKFYEVSLKILEYWLNALPEDRGVPGEYIFELELLCDLLEKKLK